MKHVWSLIGLMLWLFSLVACVTPPSQPIVVRGPATTGPQAPSPNVAFVPDMTFTVCRGLRVQNAPSHDRNGDIYAYSQLVVYEGRVAIAPKPLNGGCLSSGFGQRNGRLHEGIDISAPLGTWVFAAAPGRVLEAGWAGGYGYQIVLSHGYGLFTRYAHLSAFAEGLNIGDEVGFGTLIGQVGNSSTQRIGVHLHYEVLTGRYDTPEKSFGLTAQDPFSLPAYIPPPSS
ncbi:MAG: M23 family metallopeptidase [Pseudomonadota bacterium]